MGGIIVKTDRESQAQLASAFSSLSAGLIAATDWKGQNGWVTVTLAEISPLAQAVAAHVKACFAQERAYGEQLAALATPAEVAAFMGAATF